jgi:hypothetical protein
MIICRVIALCILAFLFLLFMVFPEGAIVSSFIGVPIAVILLLSKKGGAV